MGSGILSYITFKTDIIKYFVFCLPAILASKQNKATLITLHLYVHTTSIVSTADALFPLQSFPNRSSCATKY